MEKGRESQQEEKLDGMEKLQNLENENTDEPNNSSESVLSLLQKRKRKREALKDSKKLIKLATGEKIKVQEDEELVTDMYEIQEAQGRLEEEALFQKKQNWGKEDSCTFNQSYRKQPVYACATCTKNPREPFGFCFGCSMNCHVDHQVYELFDKPHFRCDCGTPKSGCNCIFDLNQERVENNNENEYNHNFNGLYCWCNRPYEEEEETMYQCCLCFDWFHLECIQEKESDSIPTSDISCDFFCQDCVRKCPFLMHYLHLSVNSPKEITLSDLGEECKIKSLKELPIKNLFFKKEWKNELCTCLNCSELYKMTKLNRVIEDKGDIENESENEDLDEKEENISMYDASVQAFLQSKLPHTTRNNLSFGLQHFMSNFKAWAKQFADQKKEITERDIQEFSKIMKDRKPDII